MSGTDEELKYEGLRSEISELRLKVDVLEETLTELGKVVVKLNAENSVLRESNNKMIAFLNNLPQNREFMAVFVRNSFEAYAEAEKNLKERGQGDVAIEWSSVPFNDPSCLKVVLESGVDGATDAIHIFVKNEASEWVETTTNLNIEFVKEITEHLYKEEMDKDVPHYLIMKYTYGEAIKQAATVAEEEPAAVTV